MAHIVLSKSIGVLMKLTFLAVLFVYFSLEAIASPSEEFKVLHESRKGPSIGKIFVIGTIHEHLEMAKNCEQDISQAKLCRRGFTEIVNQNSRNLDIVLFEGNVNNEALIPKRQILNYSSESIAKVHAEFDKDLYIVGWEEPIVLLISKLAHSIYNNAINPHSRLNVIPQLRALYFYYYVILEQRNKVALRTLLEVVQRANPNKNIFLLIGGAHLTDPAFKLELGKLDRDYVIYQNKNINPKENNYQEFLDTQRVLEQMGESPDSLKTIFNELKATAIRQGGFTHQDVELAEKRILFGGNSKCNESLSATQ